MAAELTVLSFLCAIFLVVFLPIKRVYLDAPKLAIILWLLAYNLIHAINSVIWVGNDDIHAVGWCDVATKIMMGANMALPGAFLCLSRRLELVSSSRPISTHKTVERNRTILEIVLCCILPILYMSLHFVAQDYRFDLVKKFGCSPSVHQSTLGFILIWGPPLILSVISLVLSAFALHHARSLTSYRFMEHLQPRSTVITTSIFYRQLSITMIISSLLVFFNIFVFFSVSHYVPWVSWASVHATVSDVDVVQSGSILRTIQVRWWSVFVISLIYVLLCFAFGEETRDAYQYMKRLSARFGMASTSRPAAEGPSSSAPKAKGAKMRPLTLELKSGWDDMLHERSPRLKSIRSKSPMLSSPSACSSPTPSSKSRAEDDEAFMTSTLSYLGSPAAKSLGITSPVTPTTPSPRAAFELLSNPIPTPPPPMPSTQSAPSTPSTPPKPVPAKLPSHITVVLEQEWPVPPASPSPSRSVSRHGSPSPTGSISRAHSRINSQPDSCPQSPTASVLDEGIDLSEITFGIPLYSPSTPPHLRARPFENSSISSMNELGVHTPTSPNAPMPPKRGILKRPSIRSLNRKFSRERLSSGSSTAPGDVIRMSIVHETV